jgi:hypothetical protein
MNGGPFIQKMLWNARRYLSFRPQSGNADAALAGCSEAINLRPRTGQVAIFFDLDGTSRMAT